MTYCLPCTNNLKITSKPSVSDIIDRACSYFEITFNELIRRKRYRSLVEKRQMLLCLLRDNSSMSLTEIGVMFGGFDHTTVIHSVKTISNLVEVEDSYREYFRGLNRFVFDK